MRIAMVSEHASPLAVIGGVDAGGQNVHVAALAAALARQGHEVVVHTRRDDPDLPARVTMLPGVVVYHVDAGPPEPLPKDELLGHMPEMARELARRWVRRRPDVVHAHFWMSGIASLLGVVDLGVPVVQTFHALGSEKRRHQGAADTSPDHRVRLETRVARDVDLVLATSTAEIGELASLGVPTHRVEVVPCGVELERFSPYGPVASRTRGHRLVSVGRLVERKGVDTAVRALAELVDAGFADTELVVAGGPESGGLRRDPEARRLRAVAREVGVEDHVRLLGRVGRQQLPALLRSADVVVAVPWYEPFGIVPLEAMASGCPVVGSAVGGLLDTVVDGGTGLLVPPRDPAALAAALGRLLGDPALREDMGAAGRRRAEELYGWDEVAARTAVNYRRVVRRRGAALHEPAVGLDQRLEAMRP